MSHSPGGGVPMTMKKGVSNAIAAAKKTVRYESAKLNVIRRPSNVRANVQNVHEHKF